MPKYAEIFPPGEFLKDELKARNWSQVEFAEIIGRPVRLVNEIISGKKAVTPETAIQLSASLGTSPELWLNLENQYQLSKVSIIDNKIQKRSMLYERFPVRELIRRCWINAVDNTDQLEKEILDFYSISSIDENIQFVHAAKKTSYSEVTISQFSWLFRVKQIAESHVVPKYNRDALINTMPYLRAFLSAPEETRHIAKLLNDVGVHFIVVEALPRSKIDGACLWLNDSRPVIAISNRLDRIDNFWFVIRHELEHLLQEHGKEARSIMIDEDIDQNIDTISKEENEANYAAQNFCVTDQELDSYINRVNPYFFSEDRILGFAGRIGVHPGIVVGRVQKFLEKRNYPNPYRYLRHYLVKVRQFVTQSSPTDGWGTVYPTK